MPIQSGDPMPHGVFRVMTETGPRDLSSEELFSNKKVVLVSVPGAFTKTCSNYHLPGFLAHADEILARGVDTIAFMSVNDVDVMHAWGIHQQVGDKIAMLADGNGDYARALQVEVDLRVAGMGHRSRRFAIIVDDGIASHVAIEQPRQFEVSTAEAVLARL